MKIRYSVYCLRKGWEPAGRFPDERERDEFDDSAVHILLTERNSKHPVGTARVIYADPTAEHGNLPSLGWAPEFREKAKSFLPLARTIEVSRLTVSQAAAATAGSARSSAANGAQAALGLIKGMLRATAFDGVTTVCLTTTLSLKRLLHSTGLRFHDIGVRVRHRGVRAPLFRDIPALLAELHQVAPETWRYVSDNGATWPLDLSALDRERDARLGNDPPPGAAARTPARPAWR